jgi:RimJ/RimL family protein N-acetyltransferase
VRSSRAAGLGAGRRYAAFWFLNQPLSFADHEATTMTTIIIPTLATQRLTLRAFTATDLDALAPIYADPVVSRYIGDGTPADRAATWRALAGMLGHWQLRGYGMWALIEQATGRLIGRAGLYNPDGWPGLEAGWLLARDRWGHGFATEAGHAVLAYAFTQVSADHVISIIHQHWQQSREAQRHSF